ncbi:hypothetical protein MCUN1_003788 [Malassezia cuniculi]|uniref:RlpA-like protein double-psi beta-barrel domain-containing protein n=1 Tax=Malassezia cuniculi TaxID=948313 RepID=A0AAF0J7R0_9BASI|nr:hypothetical protein MCUN1_003788 [Malassezia cuniculi]
MFSLRIAAVALLSIAGVIAAPTHNTGKVSARDEYHSGQATFYNAEESAGNCGWWNNNGDHIVALNTVQYGSTDYVSDWCGKLVRIVNTENGKVRHAVIADSCPGCGEGSLDLSMGLFADLNEGNMDEGIFPIEWTVIF